MDPQSKEPLSLDDLEFLRQFQSLSPEKRRKLLAEAGHNNEAPTKVGLAPQLPPPPELLQFDPTAPKKEPTLWRPTK